jgi:hypothetical protein
MNKPLLTTLVVAAVISAANAGQPIVDYKSNKTTVVEQCFADQELQLDIYAAYVSSEGDGGHGDGWGGGLGLNYYFNRHLGAGLDATATDGSGDVLYQFSGNLLLRWPIEGSLCWAPYAKLGGGYQMNGSGDAFLTAGAGFEIRFNPKLGFFTEGSYNWSDDDDNFIQARAGLRIVF